MSVLNASIAEGNAGTQALVFQVALNLIYTLPVSVDFTTADGTAVTPDDYVATSGTVVIEPGQLGATVEVDLVGDTVFEPNEFFYVELSNPVNATLFDAQAVGTILNDDVQPSLRIADAFVLEDAPGFAVFEVALSRPTSSAVLVDFTMVDGSAVGGSDYTPGSGTLSFAPGETIETLMVPVLADGDIEPDEDFFVDLSAANVPIADPTGIGWIVNDDFSPICGPGWPLPVTGLRIDRASGTSALRLSWTDAADSDDYLVRVDGAATGSFGTLVGIVTSGAVGLEIPLPPGDGYYLVGGRNDCGFGPE